MSLLENERVTEFPDPLVTAERNLRHAARDFRDATLTRLEVLRLLGELDRLRELAGYK